MTGNFISHTDALATATDRVICRIIDGVEIDPKARENLICVKEAVERILDGRINSETDHLKLWGEISEVARNGLVE